MWNPVMDARKESRGVMALPNLPTEIMTEILLNLPVKSLLKFKCVSKSWLSLISSSEFIKSHLNRSKKSNNFSNHSIILSTHPLGTYYTCSLTSVLSSTVMDNATVVDFPLRRPNSVVGYVGSCNGLLCVCVKLDLLVLYNPSIRSFKTLPVSGISWGFCYDEFNDDYKVVELTEIEVKVYSLRNDSWRIIENKYRDYDFRPDAVNIGGIIHWFIDKDDSPTLIMAVNTVTYRCDTLTPPKQHDIIVDEPGSDSDDPGWSSDEPGSGMVELDGCLCVYYDYFNIRLDVWVMKEYGVKESWTKLFSIPYPGNLQSPVSVYPMFMLKNGDICLDCVSYTVIYNSRNNSFTTPAIYTIEGSTWSAAGPMYIESLVSTSLVGE